MKWVSVDPADPELGLALSSQLSRLTFTEMLIDVFCP